MNPRSINAGEIKKRGFTPPFFIGAGVRFAVPEISGLLTAELNQIVSC